MALPHQAVPIRPRAEPLAVAPASSPYQKQILLSLTVLTSVWLWLLPIGSSFWLDELVTYWSSYKGVIPALTRSQFWPGQNLPYSVLAAIVIRVAGTSEIALRLPSLLATALTAWLLFRLAQHFFDKEAGALVALVFVSLHEIAKEAATNARPYAIALLLVVASVLQLVRWLDKRRLRNMLGFVFATAAIPYFQYLFATVYIALLAYAVYVVRAERRVRIRDLAAAAALIIILLVPLVANAVLSHRISSQASFADPPDANLLMSSFIPSILAGGLFLGVLLGCFVCRPSGFMAGELPHSANFLFAVLFAIPIATAFIVARISPFKIFVERYYLPSFVGLALIVGAWIRTFAVPRMRTIIATLIALGSIASYSGLHWGLSPHREDWRAAAQTVRAANISSTTPVLLRVGLVETTKINWGLDIDRDSPLLCLLSKYPMPGRIVLLPSGLSPETISYLEEVNAQLLKPAARFLLVVRNDNREFNSWMRGWFMAQGFEASPLVESKGLSVFQFRRTALIPAPDAP